MVHRLGKQADNFEYRKMEGKAKGRQFESTGMKCRGWRIFMFQVPRQVPIQAFDCMVSQNFWLHDTNPSCRSPAIWFWNKWEICGMVSMFHRMDGYSVLLRYLHTWWCWVDVFISEVLIDNWCILLSTCMLLTWVQQPDSQEASNKTKDAREPTSLRQCSWYNRQHGLLPANPSQWLDSRLQCDCQSNHFAANTRPSIRPVSCWVVLDAWLMSDKLHHQEPVVSLQYGKSCKTKSGFREKNKLCWALPTRMMLLQRAIDIEADPMTVLYRTLTVS